MTRKNNIIFGVDTICDYMNLCVKAVNDFEKSQDNVLKAFTAILILNHIVDWLQYKLTTPERGILRISGSKEESVQNHFEGQNSDLILVRDIANGFKHLRLKQPTKEIKGFGCGPYGTGPFGAPYLLIDPSDHLSPDERGYNAFSLCQKVLAWWQTQLSILPLADASNSE